MDAPVHVINLSIGGPDHLDAPFVDKVLEVTARGALLISAIGNDGPLYGTLNNPADQPDVIGVGGVSKEGELAPFSSRGMSTWELPQGTGRAKPDVVAWARDVPGSRMDGDGCRALSGTSVASPVVAGCVALLASTVPAGRRWGPRGLLNPASMKQALVGGAVRIGGGANVWEQGAGRVSLGASQALLAAAAAAPSPRASLHPARIDLTDCPYAWPHCKQPLYARAMPVVVNATILNPLGPRGRVVGAPTFEPSSAEGDGGRYLHVSFTWSELLWPWSGHLSVHAEVSPEAANFTGPATGTIRFTVESPAPQRPYGGGNGTTVADWKETEAFSADASGRPVRLSVVEVPFVARVQPTPPRHRRLLWDVFHSIRYPPGYLPRDDLDVRGDILDWHGDHPYTNYHETLDALLDAGFAAEVLASPSTCFDAREYGALLVADPEDEWYLEERRKLSADVADEGLALLVFGEWYNAASLGSMRFYDDNTRSWWLPATGGGNVPAINELLAAVGGDAPAEGEAGAGGEGEASAGAGANGVTGGRAGGAPFVPAGPAIAFGDAIITGGATLAGIDLKVAYGAAVARMPPGSWLHRAPFADHAAGPEASARAAFGLGPGGDGGPDAAAGAPAPAPAPAPKAAAGAGAAGRRLRVRLDGSGGGGGGKEGGRSGGGGEAEEWRRRRTQRQQARRRRRRRGLAQDAAPADPEEDAGADGEPQDLPARDQKDGEHGALGIARVGRGAVALFADSNCLDASHGKSRCHGLLLALLRRYAAGTPEAERLAASPELEGDGARLSRQYTSSRWAATAAAAAPLAKKAAAAAARGGGGGGGAARFDGPGRRPGASFDDVSFVRARPHQCYMSAPCAFRSRVGGPGGPGREEAATTAGWACPAEQGAWPRTSAADEDEDEGAAAKAAAEAKKRAQDEAAAAAAAEKKKREREQDDEDDADGKGGGGKAWAQGADAAVRAPQATTTTPPAAEEAGAAAAPLPGGEAATAAVTAAPARASARAGAPEGEEGDDAAPAAGEGRVGAALPALVLRHSLNLALAICMAGAGAVAVMTWGRRRAAGGGGGGGDFGGARGSGDGADGGGGGGFFGRASRFSPPRRGGGPPTNGGGGGIALAERGSADERAPLRGAPAAAGAAGAGRGGSSGGDGGGGPQQGGGRGAWDGAPPGLGSQPGSRLLDV